VRGVKVVEFDTECIQVGELLGGNALDQFLRRYIFLTCTNHDRRAVRIAGANVNAVVATQFLEAHPDIRLDVFHQVAQVNGSIGIRQRAGNEHGASGVCHRVIVFRLAAIKGGDYATSCRSQALFGGCLRRARD